MKNNYFLPFLVSKGECSSDNDCSDREACIDHQCTNPCREPFDPCGQHAICTPESHTAVCMCPVGWAGHAHEECFQCKKKQSYLQGYILKFLTPLQMSAMLMMTVHLTRHVWPMSAEIPAFKFNVATGPFAVLNTT